MLFRSVSQSRYVDFFIVSMWNWVEKVIGFIVVMGKFVVNENCIMYEVDYVILVGNKIMVVMLWLDVVMV